MSRQILHETLLDGIILIFQDFKALKFCKNFMLPSNVVIQRVLSTHYRSSTIFSYYKKIIKVGFGFHNDMPLDVVVAYRKDQTANTLTNDIIGSESDEEEIEEPVEVSEFVRKNEFKIIREAFIEAINYSTNKIGCWQHQCCKLYENILKRKGCSCFNNRYIEARHDTTIKFGQSFFDTLKNTLREKLENNRLDVLFTVRDVGQNVSYSRAFLILQRYQLKYVKELLIHCSRDYWTPDYALLWDAHYLKSLHHGPKLEYYPGLIKGHGNFYYKHKHNRHEEEEIKLHKYYSQLFKEVDKTGPKNISPFSRPLLKYYLCEKFNLPKNIDYVKWIECVEGTLSLYSNKNYMYCREELIGSSIKPSNEKLEQILDFFKAQLLPQRNSSKYFTNVRKDRFLGYINGYMEPLLNCIKSEISKKATMELASKFYYISDGKHSNTEMLILDLLFILQISNIICRPTKTCMFLRSCDWICNIWYS